MRRVWNYWVFIIFSGSDWSLTVVLYSRLINNLTNCVKLINNECYVMFYFFVEVMFRTNLSHIQCLHHLYWSSYGDFARELIKKVKHFFSFWLFIHAFQYRTWLDTFLAHVPLPAKWYFKGSCSHPTTKFSLSLR